MSNNNNQSHEELGFAYCKILTDKEDNIIDVEFIEANPAFEKHTGIKPNSVTGKKLSQLFPGLSSSANNWITKYGEPILEGKRVTFEEYAEPLHRWFKVDVNPTGNNCFIALFADITKQKEAEALVKGSVEERFHNFVRNSTGPVFVIDRKGNYLDGNIPALEFLECSRIDLLTKNIRDTFLFENGEENLFRQDLQEERLGTIDAEFRANGNSKFIELTFSPAIWEGKPAILSVGRDVTKIKKTKQTSKQTETMFKKIVENSNEVIMLTRPDGAVEYLSPSCKEIFGYEPNELVNNALEIFHPDDSEKAQSALASAYLGKSGMHLEYRIITKDQQVRWVNHSWTPIIEDGDLKMIVSNIADITDRKQAIDNLKESEEKYRGLVEKINVGIYRSTTDPSGKILEANPAFARLFGYSSPEELKKLSLTDLYQNSEERKLFLANLNTYGFAKNEHLRLKKKDGTPIIASVTGRIHQDVNGKIEWFDGIVEDITERKKAEEALIASEEKYRSLVGNLNLGIYRSTVDDPGKFIEANPSMCAIFGYDCRTEIVKNVSVSELYLNPEDQKTFLQKIQKDGFVKAEEVKLKKKDGTPFIASVTARVHKNSSGKIEWIDGVIEDITERKKAERALRESEEKYRTLVERASDGIVIIQNGVVTYANPVIIQMWGGSAEEVIGKPFTDFIHPDALPIVIERYKKRVAGEFVSSIYETELIRKDGIKFPAELNANVIIQNGIPVDFVIVRDLSERKKGEKENINSQDRFKIIFDASPDAYYLCDLKGNFIDGNKASENLLGYKCEELKGKNLLELGLLPTIRFPKAITILAKNALGLHTEPDVVTITRKDGREIDIELKTVTVQLQNETAVLAIGREAIKNKQSVSGTRKKDEIYHITAEHTK